MYEVYKKIALQRDEEEALSAIGWMSMGKIVELTQELALSAGVLSMEHKLPMADSVILATVRAHDATLWTQDEHFKDLEGVRYIEKKSEEKKSENENGSVRKRVGGSWISRGPRSSVSSKPQASSTRGTRHSASMTRRTSTKAPCGRPPSR
jgi:hypothetical protein